MKLEIRDFEEKMKKCLAATEREFSSVRAGRANASILDRVTVDYYGSPTPINQLAQIATPEARMLVITPWDASSVKDIEKAILASDIGITPQTTERPSVLPSLSLPRREERN